MSGQCPECGGQERTALAPGFFECTTQRIVGYAPENHPGNPMSSPAPVYHPCHHRYQEGSPGVLEVLCSCGLGAIGVCRDCGRAVCGVHGGHDAEGRFLCAEDLITARATAAERTVVLEAESRRQLEEERQVLEREASEREAARIEASIPGAGAPPYRGDLVALVLADRARSNLEEVRYPEWRPGKARPTLRTARAWRIITRRYTDRDSSTPTKRDLLWITTDGRVFDQPGTATEPSERAVCELTAAEMVVVVEHLDMWGASPSPSPRKRSFFSRR